MLATRYEDVVKLQGGADSACNTPAPYTTNLTREIVMPQKRSTLPRSCDQCGSRFDARTDHISVGYGRFCTKKCSGIARRRWRSLTCLVCESEFYRRPSGTLGPRYCSRYCHNLARSIGTVDRFWSNLDRSGKCWLNRTGTIDRLGKGYRRMTVAGCSTAAHVLAYRLTYGAIPIGLWVLHRCDNPPCVRPDHLFLGTVQDNNADAVAKGRTARGEKNGSSKLTALQVTEIRRLCYEEGVLQKDIARRFGLYPTTVNRIVKGRRWGHLLATDVLGQAVIGDGVVVRTVKEDA